MSDTTVSSNFVHGDGAPVGSVFAPTPDNDPYVRGNHAENNQNLLSTILIPLIPWLLIFAFIWFFVFRQLRNSAGAGTAAMVPEGTCHSTSIRARR